MDYKETVDYLFESAPLFQQLGAGAYKEGLNTTHLLDEHFGHPHKLYRTIHVAGTNGKGSCSHTLAAILQSAGYKVGLYTSPHLVDFRERIRVNGKMISEQYVIDFVANNKSFFEPLHPSFFELATAMAFRYFADEKVDVAVIEVGLGGRLDCTNIITPILGIITNISFDHTQFLGNTLAKIAGEKAGIIKPHIPIIIGETNSETRPVFAQKAAETGTTIVFAEDTPLLLSHKKGGKGWILDTELYPALEAELGGYCQLKNANTLLHALPLLQQAGFNIDDLSVRKGFSEVCELTGLMGRWQKLNNKPLMICDTGHNVGGITYIAEQLQTIKCRQLRIVMGMVNDKDISGVLALLPQNATYYFTQAGVKRALTAEEVKQKATAAGLKGRTFHTVIEAVKEAQKESLPEDCIFVGGSSFIVADLMAGLSQLSLSL